MVVDHRPAEVAELVDFVCRGGRLLLTEPIAELSGATAGERFGHGEWFATLGSSPAAARLDPEFAVAAELVELVPAEGTEVLVTTSVGFRHRPTVVARQMGAGLVVTCGFGPPDRALAHAELGRFLRRVLARSASTRTAPFGVGVVGYGPFGGMGYTHGLAATETEGLAFTAVCDLAEDRRAAAVTDFAGVAAYASVTDLAADDGVDVAIVATAPSLHAQLALELLRAGKHVVVEKPMCLTVAEADELLAVAASVGRSLTVHQSRRWDADFLTLQRAIQDGLLGEVFNIETFVGGFEHPCRAWHSEDSISGGAVYDWGSHHVDWILQLFGSAPAEVVTWGHKRVWRDVTNLDQLTLHLQWADGREATFRQSDVAAVRRPKFYVQGTEGTVEGWYRPLQIETVAPGRGYQGRWAHHAEAPVELRLVRYVPHGGGLVERTLPPVAGREWGFHRNLADHLHLGEPLAIDPAFSRQVVAVLEASHHGANGEVIRL